MRFKVFVSFQMPGCLWFAGCEYITLSILNVILSINWFWANPVHAGWLDTKNRLKENCFSQLESSPFSSNHFNVTAYDKAIPDQKWFITEHIPNQSNLRKTTNMILINDANQYVLKVLVQLLKHNFEKPSYTIYITKSWLLTSKKDTADTCIHDWHSWLTTQDVLRLNSCLLGLSK